MKAAFLGAADLAPETRGLWLDEHCLPEHRAEVEALLARHDLERAGGAEGDVGREGTETAWNILSSSRPFGSSASPLERGALEPFEVLDEFRILRRIDSGGMAIVYLAEDTSLRRRVALKVLPISPGLSEVAVARFRQEAVTVAQLQHPAIVPIHRVGEANGVHYLAMEFIDGPTLAGRIDQLRGSAADDGMSVASTVAYVKEQAQLVAVIAGALDYAHRHDVIHRDIKPSNILIGPDGLPRLTDFGIARNLRLQSVTTTGQLAGTVPYMSPEQARASNRGVDHRTDIYSLGVTLYETLTLQRPFSGDSVEDIRQKVIWKQPRRVTALNPSVSRDLETILHKALEKDPAHRYQTVAHMAADLRCFLDDRPILARPPSMVRRARVWTRDHRTAALSGTIAILVIAVVALVAVIQQRRAATMTPVTVTAGQPGTQLRARPIDRLTGRPGPSREVGRLPIEDRRIDPGQYLFTATAPDGAFSETIVYVPRPDERMNLATGRNESPLSIVVNFVTPSDEQALIEDMVLIKGETLTAADGSPIVLRDFWIDRYEVSNAEYRAFLNATGHPWPYHWSAGKPQYTYDEALADRPVVGITLADATAYATYHGKRLPLDYEWQFAMSRPDGRIVPWSESGERESPLVPATTEDIERGRGTDWTLALELYARNVHPVRSDPQLATPLGIHHANSNVREMTASFAMQRGSVSVACGGSWVDHHADFTGRYTSPWNTASMVQGFRCVRSAASEP